MMEAQAIGPVMRGNRAPKSTAFLFGAVIYFTFIFTILYATGFVSGFAAPKTIDTGAKTGAFEAIVLILVLMPLFAVQRSTMARRPSKQWSTQFIPGWIERGTDMLLAGITPPCSVANIAITGSGYRCRSHGANRPDHLI